jgi:LuxR family glucitol operon transcriptional activator
LDTVLDALYGARGDIFEEIFSRSWSLLSEPARRVLMVMPIFATSASKAAIEAASDVHNWDLDEGLGQLVEMWLVEASSELDEAKRRYSVHPLTRAFAVRELGKNTEFEREARLRVAGYFLDFLRQHGGENWRGYDIVELDVINILAIVDWCYETGNWRALIDFVNSLNYFLGIRGYWDERIRYGKKAMQASENLGDMQSFAWIATFVVGWTLYGQGYTEQGKELTMKALHISEEHNYHKGIATALCNLGRFAYLGGEFDKAQHLYAKGLKLWEQIGNQRPIAAAHRDLGTIALYQGDIQEAKRQLEEAQRQFEEIDDTQGLASTYRRLGNLAEQRGDYEQAQWFYEEYLTLAQETGNLCYIGSAKSDLAFSKEQQQDYQEALALARDANEVYQRLGIAVGIEKTRKLVERLEKTITEGRR